MSITVQVVQFHLQMFFLASSSAITLSTAFELKFECCEFNVNFVFFYFVYIFQVIGQ